MAHFWKLYWGVTLKGWKSSNYGRDGRQVACRTNWTHQGADRLLEVTKNYMEGGEQRQET